VSWPIFMSSATAAAYLTEHWGVRRAAKTLRNLRWSGGGPAFRYDGRRALYDRNELDRWAQAQLSAIFVNTGQAHLAQGSTEQ
jgi:hypothetical protein